MQLLPDLVYRAIRFGVHSKIAKIPGVMGGGIRVFHYIQPGGE